MASVQEREAWLFKLLLHAEGVFSTRTNFFFIAHTVLMVTLATITDKEGAFFYEDIFRALGFWLGIVWLIVGSRSYKHLEQLSRRVKNTFPEYEGWSKRSRGLVPVNAYMGIVFPLIFIIAWFMLIMFNFPTYTFEPAPTGSMEYFVVNL
ncbi:MAG: hypothetical protein WED06_01105 [Candidatus Paceibacterota bacterium]